MDKNEKYLSDISEIRNIMERSSRVLTLSGLSGVFIGCYALIGAYLGYRIIYFSDEIIYSSLERKTVSDNIFLLILILGGIFTLSIATALYFSNRKARKSNVKFWGRPTRLLVINLLIPLIAGGVLVLILFLKGAIGLIAPITLIFYGLALINAGKYTFDELKYLGLGEIILGLCSAYFIGYGLIFWALGFGVLHIIYGGLMYLKYEK